VLAAYAASLHPDDPLAGLVVGERPEPDAAALAAADPGHGPWTTVRLKAAGLNHHDLWSLRGVGLGAGRLPMILGCDGAGVDADGNEVIVHAVIADPGPSGDETLDPRRSLLSERHQGTFAEVVAVPRRNLVPRPAFLSWEQAACLPTAWLTAYRMLFVAAALRPGDTVLVQGAGGGVATAAISLAAGAGLRVWATSRSEAKQARAVQLGAQQAFGTGARLPERVDAVIDSVGAATWSHSLKCLRPGGALVLCGATSGPNPAEGELNRIFFQQLRILGSTMGTRAELERLIGFLGVSGVRPVIDSVHPLADARAALDRLQRGDVVGKVVLRP
jgi:NADPH:quinone reductase-like Zn-dependent oxidoreductase